VAGPRAARISGDLVKSETCSIASQDLKGRRVFRRLESGLPRQVGNNRGIYPQRRWLSKQRENFFEARAPVRLPDMPGWIDSTGDARWSV